MATDTRVVPATAPASVQLAAQILRAGGVVALPTDTVYGVAAHAYLPEAIERLFQAKRRPHVKAIALLVADPDDLSRVARHVPDAAWELARRFWPGALTLIVPRADHLPAILTAGGDTIGVRMPNHPVTLSVIAATGVPLATTSANLSGSADPITAGAVLRDLGGRIELLLDGGACPGGIPSTLLDLTTDPPAIRRPGPIDRDTLKKAIGGEVV